VSLDEVNDAEWWTWANGTRRAHLRYRGATTVCGRGPVWYAGDGEGFTPAPAHLPRCGTCSAIAGRLPGMLTRVEMTAVTTVTYEIDPPEGTP
jgi:hypothetical protein